MAATKKFMVGKGNIWIFPGKWWFDCMIVITGHCFEKTSLLLVVRNRCLQLLPVQLPRNQHRQHPPRSGGMWRMPRSNKCWPKSKGRTRCGDYLGGEGWWCVKSWSLEFLLFFFFWGGGWKISSVFFWFSVFECSSKRLLLIIFGLEVTLRWCTASSLFLVALASTIFPFFEHPC